MQPAQPAVAPGGGAAGGGGSIFSTTPTRPSNVNLTPEQQQAIVSSLGSGVPSGSFIVGGTAVSQPKMGKNPVGADVLIDTGEYQITVQTPDGRTLPMTVTRNTDPQGNDSWIAQPPKDTTSTTKATSPTDYVVKTTDNGTWYPNDVNNPGGGYHMIVPAGVKNEDEEITKAVDRQVKEGDRNARQRNLDANGFYGTDTEYANFIHQAQADKLNQADLQEKIRQFNVQHQYDDQQEKRADDKAASDLLTAATGRAATQASTAATQATTAQTQQNIDIARQKLPGELTQQQATLAATQASTAKTLQDIQQGKAPAPVQATLGTGYGQYASIDPSTGQVTFNQNPNFQAKTQADVAARVGQIQALMTQKGQEAQAKVGQMVNGKLYTAEDALRDFNSWHDQNVAPQQAQLQAAQEEAQFTRAKDEASMRQQAYQTALGAGTQQVSAINARTNMNPVGAGYADVMDLARQGKMPTGQQMASAFTYQAQDPTQVAQQATQDAYKALLGGGPGGGAPPNPQAIDIAGMLNRTNYGGPQAAPPAPAPAPAATAGANWLPGWPGSDPRLSGNLNPEPNAPRPLPSQFANPIYAGLNQGTGPYGPPPPPSSPQMPFGAISANPWNFAPDYSFG